MRLSVCLCVPLSLRVCECARGRANDSELCGAVCPFPPSQGAVAAGFIVLPTLHFCFPLWVFLRDALGIPAYDQDGKLRVVAIADGKPMLGRLSNLDDSAVMRARLFLLVVVIGLAPVTFVVLGVGVPVLHSVLLRCCRVRWPLWYSALDLMHTCLVLPMSGAAVVQVCCRSGHCP